MRRLIGRIIGIGLLVAIAVWLADRPGTVSLQWQGWRVDTSVAMLLGSIATVAVGYGDGYPRALSAAPDVRRASARSPGV